MTPHQRRHTQHTKAHRKRTQAQLQHRTQSRTSRLQVKSSFYSPNFIEQTSHCDHKPRAAQVYVRLLLHRRSAAGWAEYMIYSALVLHMAFLPPPEVGLGETMAELAGPRGNSARRALFSFAARGE